LPEAVERTSRESPWRGKSPWHLAIIILSLCLLLLIVLGSSALQPPFELQVADVESSGMYDRKGSETLLVDLHLINHSARLAYLNARQARFRVFGEYVSPALMDASVPNYLRAHTTERLAVLVPAAALNVQLEVDYQFEPWQQSMTRSLGSGGRSFLVRLVPKRILSWLWPVVSGPNSNGWQRTEIRSDLIMQPVAAVQGQNNRFIKTKR
jgi:hypothetical protein